MSWSARFRNVFGKRRYEAEMAEEMRLHLELREERLRASGQSAEAARLQTRREFGGVEQIKERSRAQSTGLREVFAFSCFPVANLQIAGEPELDSISQVLVAARDGPAHA